MRRTQSCGCRVASTLASTVAVALAALGGLATAGCARTAEERHLDDMREEIERIQVDRDHSDPAEPEAHRASASNAAVPSGAGQGPGVVTVGQSGAEPWGDESSPDTEDTTPRPSIRVFGSPRSGGRYASRGQDRVEESVPEETEGATVPRPAALDPQAKKAYDAALSLVNARHYDTALDALAAFLLKWPEHPYADNAMYWRGECYFAKGEYARAAEQFEGVVTRFPAGNKAPDAMLKLGICDQKLGNPMRAKGWFDRLAQQYPQSEAARRIPAIDVPAVAPSGPASEAPR
jgi:tol-pal system protein YbgF